MKGNIDSQLILRMHSEGKSQREIAREVGCSKTTVLKTLRKLQSDGGHPSGDQAGDDVVMTVPPHTDDGPSYFQTQRYLRKKSNNLIFAWTEFIAAKDGFEEVRWDGERFVLVMRDMIKNLNDFGK